MSRERRRMHGRRSFAGVLFVFALALSLVTACQKDNGGATGPAIETTPVAVGEASVPLTGRSLGDDQAEVPVEVKIADQVRLDRIRLVSHQTGAAAVSQDPVLVVRLEFKNAGTQKIAYNPPHDQPASASNPVPQLWGIRGDSLVGEEIESTQIPRINFQNKFVAENQHHEGNIEILPQSNVQDIFIFDGENADKYKHFMLLVPANLFGGSASDVVSVTFPRPAQFQGLDYEAPPGIGAWVENGHIKLQLAKVELGEVSLTNPQQAANPEAPKQTTAGESFIKVHYQLKNTGDSPIAYDSLHSRTGELTGITLQALDATGRSSQLSLINLTVGGSWQVQGRPAERRITVQPGQTIDDFILFDLPPEGTAKLRLALSAHIFGSDNSRGLMTFEMPVPEPPAAPAPETPPEETPEESGDGDDD